MKFTKRHDFDVKWGMNSGLVPSGIDIGECI